MKLKPVSRAAAEGGGESGARPGSDRLASCPTEEAQAEWPKPEAPPPKPRSREAASSARPEVHIPAEGPGRLQGSGLHGLL
jgi:hypothetical protein